MNRIKFVNLYFTDLIGVFRSTSILLSNDEDPSSVTALFDGSSVYGFLDISFSDVVLKPVKETEILLPWDKNVYGYIAQVYLPGWKRLDRDPRYIAERTEDIIRREGYRSVMGVEMEFFLFEKLKYIVEAGRQILEIYSAESPWTDNISIPLKKGYHIVESIDRVAHIRRSIILALHEAGLNTVKHHHEVASSGQVEITSNKENTVSLGDFIQYFKMIARKVARMHGFEAVFMPKPIMSDNGNGMHIHVSLWSKNINLFYDQNEKYGLSQLARYFMGGLLDHGRSLSAIVSPTTNSYRRLIPGYEAPVYLVWGYANRSAAVRIPLANKDKGLATRIEYRPPDPTANPYLAASAILLAGLDGVKKKIDPGDPIEENVYKMSAEKRKSLGIRELPRNLDEALDELESDHEYLKPAFREDVIQTYIELKRSEIRELAGIPSPAEFLYYNLI
ncbi:type I glutamate--ammonia ligase [Staphylothermus hellenicus]|uniref:Glutamate--ammonia ligase n=1 Tax=Staphylothermus hellenicus (strain DSM 12710 / JCM 10830 / BK20S6-10-b1 / P8) TaxID=591019 RepID=D7DC69_STAHD|nr:type I glutamate--ammonia ligase [Staphylothermus hellenicus]ADI31766.1 glutamine synthetase, type I [Staphylothermus hellenicus DSM 12710]